MDIAAELFTLPAFATLMVGLVAGLLRGFTGFGGAVFAIPLLSLIYPPTTAIVVVLAAGLVGTAQLLPGALPLMNWRESAPIVLVALAVMPFGTYALLSIDPVLVRRGIGLFVLVAGLSMLHGWSWRGPRTTAINGAVGAASGLATGLGGVGGILHQDAGAAVRQLVENAAGDRREERAASTDAVMGLGAHRRCRSLWRSEIRVSLPLHA